MKLIISTFNIQNKYKVNNYNGIDQHGNHVRRLVSFINDYNIDILGIQELTIFYQKNLINKMSKDYYITGKYRFTKFGNLIPMIRKYNETNSIVTKYKLLDSTTKRLPFFPGIPRIITCSKILIEGKIIFVYNTHLDQSSNEIRKRQLKKIITIIGKSKGNCILMGDFNCSIRQPYFNDFIEKMEQFGMKRVNVEDTTHYKKRYPIDHIFIPDGWKIKKKEVVSLGLSTSDHKPIVIQVEVY